MSNLTCCGKLKKIATEKAKDTVWTTYKCSRCGRMQTDCEKTLSQYSHEDLDLGDLYGIIL